MMHSTTKNIIVGDVMGKYCDNPGIYVMSSCVFACKIAKKNHDFITFGLKVVLLQAKFCNMEFMEFKEVKEVKAE